LVAEKLLELGASAVCDLYDMKPFDRPRWVKEFLGALMNARRELWHPAVIVVDEAHKLAPERGKGESEALEAMLALATAGRKRGFSAIFATQRLGKLNKDAAAELLNVMIGRTWLDIDRDRAAEILGVGRTGRHAFDETLRDLQPGQFFTMGPAISRKQLLFKVAKVQTTHPEVGIGMKAAIKTPTPEQVKALLPKLADLPKHAEAKARTIEELQHEIRSLKAQIAARPKPEVDQATIERSVADAVSQRDAQHDAEVRSLRGAIQTLTGTLTSIAQLSAKAADIELPATTPAQTSGGVAAAAVVGLQNRAQVIPKSIPSKSKYLGTEKREVSVERPENIGGSHLRVLSRLAELLQITGNGSVPKEQLAAWSEYSPTGGGYNNILGKLRSAGLIDYPQQGMVAITDSGGACASPDGIPVSNQEMLTRAQRVLGGSEGRILEVVVSSYPDSISKPNLADATDFSVDGGGFNNYLGHMRTLGFVDYPQRGFVRAADWLFVE
jgi:hypothetical protein